MNQRQRYWVAVGFIIYVLTPQIIANDINSKKPLIIGSENIDYFPHYGRTHTNRDEMTGFARTLLDRFAEEEGIIQRYQLMPIKRLYQTLMQTQSIDLKYPDNPTWKSEYKSQSPIYYSHPVAHYIDGLLVHPDKDGIHLNDIHQIGTVKGFTPVPYLQLINDSRIRLIEFNQISDLIRAALSQRIDGAYVNIHVAAYQLREVFKGEAKLTFQPQLPYQHDYYYLSTINHPQYIDRFNAYLQRNSEAIHQLKLDHGLTPIKPPGELINEK